MEITLKILKIEITIAFLFPYKKKEKINNPDKKL